MIWIALFALSTALLPALLFLSNVRWFAPPPCLPATSAECVSVSVLIPARNEANGIEATISAALASSRCDVQVVVLDDQSTDATRDIVLELASTDSRVRCVEGTVLPPGWNGKQYACYQLAHAATNPLMVFIDADVRLRDDALARLANYQSEHHVDLLSAFPHQVTGTWMEKLLIPMMHYLLLGYLPFSRMRTSTDPSFAAGCGQLFLTTRDAYHRAGTHQAIAGSRHDGIKLPRAFRVAGLVTDVVDGTDLADCRMYTSAREVVRGLLKNANEGIANPKLIGVFTILLIGGSVLPVAMLFISLATGQLGVSSTAAIGIVLGHLPRAIAAYRYRQPVMGVALHSVATLIFVLLQWTSLALTITGRQIAWRGRIESTLHGEPTTNRQIP